MLTGILIMKDDTGNVRLETTQDVFLFRQQKSHLRN